MTGVRPAAVGAVAVAVLVAGVAVLGVRSADTTTTYDEQSAVEAFRSASPGPSATTPGAAPSGTATSSAADTASTVPSPSAAPSAAPAGAAAPVAAGPDTSPQSADGAPPRSRTVEPGVYRYTTEGFEEVDALGGARHDYPPRSTVTYSRSGCGTEERWQPLEERVGVTRTCRGPQGAEVRSTYQQREFFGQSQSQSYTCDPGLLVLPDDPRPGARWSGACTSDDSRAQFSVTVVGVEELSVEGRPVPVVRLRLDGTLTGSTRGTSDRELWLARANGLLVQAVGETDTDADTAGGTVRYRESYRLRLQSLTPSR